MSIAAIFIASIALTGCDDASVGDSATPKSTLDKGGPERFPSPPPREAGPPYPPGAEPESKAVARAEIAGAWRATAASDPEGQHAVPFFFNAIGGVGVGSRASAYEVGERTLRIECPDESASGPFDITGEESWTWTVGDTKIRFRRPPP